LFAAPQPLLRARFALRKASANRAIDSNRILRVTLCENSHRKFFQFILIISRAFTTLRCVRHSGALRTISLLTPLGVDDDFQF
jgi:hypothetical protein